jgi:Holliday junction resolvasome RuvABC endonuclease subunit
VKSKQLSHPILCLDVAFCNLGVAVFDFFQRKFLHTEIISTEKDEDYRLIASDNQRRCALLINSLERIRQQYKPQLVLAEMPTGASRNSRASHQMGLAFGLVVAFCFLKDLELNVISPLAVKRLIGKRRSVSKIEIQQFVISHWGEKFLPKGAKREHVADAMALIAVQFPSILGHD